MKRNKRAGRIKLPSFIGDVRDYIFAKVVAIIVLTVFLFLSFFLAKAFMYRSDYFKLRVIETRGLFLDQAAISALTNQLLNLYKGDNVFRLNLKGIARSLERSYPDAKEVIVKIILPDKLLVTLKFRKPIALVQDGTSYAIDEDGFVLPSVETLSLKDLPLIKGVNIRYDERRGKQTSSRNLKAALELLKAIKGAAFTKGYGVNSINAADLNSMSFFLRNGVEVRIGYEDFAGRLENLENTLKDPRLVIDRIKYIDVRFTDVIIGPK